MWDGGICWQLSTMSGYCLYIVRHNSREPVVYGINLEFFRNREWLGVFIK